MIVRNLLMLFILVCLAACCLKPNRNIQVAGVYAYPEQGDNKEIYELVISLTSSNFFEYTQAARKLIAKGEEALPMLCKYQHLTREVDGINLLVCPPTIRIILQQQNTVWLDQKKHTASQELQKFITQELKNRVKKQVRKKNGRARRSQ